MTADQQITEDFRGLTPFGEHMKKTAQTAHNTFKSLFYPIKHGNAVS